MAERALDIFYLLGELDKKNYDLWNKLTEEQQKEFAPLVVMRWMAGTTDIHQLTLLNDLVNIAIFNLPEHKEFLLKLLTVCSSGKPKRYSWINYKISKKSKKKISIKLVADHYNLSISEAEDSIDLFSEDELLELAEINGFQREDIKNLKKEL